MSTAGSDPDLDPFDLDPKTQVPIVDRRFGGRVLVRAILRKFARRFFHAEERIEPSAIYSNLIVYDRWSDLSGWGYYYEQDILPVLLQFAPRPCESLFEFCSGPGYIGYSMLARGLCKRLTLADVNPKVIEAARQTARENKIEHLVNVYLSDSLDQIPPSERWDLVVGNPPSDYYSGDDAGLDLIAHDPKWSVHKRFYASIKRFIKPGGRVIMMESRFQSSIALFQPMIEAGGGRVVAAPIRLTLSGKEGKVYYLVSEW